MIKKLFLVMILSAYLVVANAQDRTKHFITDATYRTQVEKAFNQVKTDASGRSEQLFSVFSAKLSLEEEEALKFLYAYMPLSDLADYDGNFFLRQVRMSLLAKKTFSWGKTIPEDIFRHFVLPYRINNENLDSSRMVFFYELKDRIKNLSMQDAALEVNHWCHEKVTYKGTDGRTSAPLSTIKTAYGRCGEESTFTVTALRTVGIPARQVYTPRWAHCDDNHAWVEVWIDGKWHFLGACEPEAGLDMAWFAAPVLRAMLCNTTVYGNYQGPEEKLKSSDNFNQINLIENYAPTKKIFVKVLNENKKPAGNATVEFQLYNYAEFYPLAKKNTDKKGMASLVTGLGDLMIWAYSDNLFAFQKVTIEKTDTLVLVLSKNPLVADEMSLCFVPPVQRQPKIPDAKGKETNDLRLKKEDSIRTSYESHFIDSANCLQIANVSNLNADSVRTILKQSRGNWNQIARFILDGALINKTYTYAILNNISEKDLHDTPESVLMDHLKYSYTKESIPKEFFRQFVLNPRIAGEILSKYKKYFNEAFDVAFIQKAQEDPSTLIKYVNENIKVSPTANYSRNPLTPKGTHNLKYADDVSRDIYFVALSRSFGIPALIDKATGGPQYYKNGIWNEVYFEKKSVQICPKASLTLTIDKTSVDFTPEYYTHFTIEKFDQGVYRSLDYEESNLFEKFPASLTLDTGRYLIVTGIRNKDGSVNTDLVFFTLKEKEANNLVMKFITNDQKTLPVATMNLNRTFHLLTTGEEKSLNQVQNGKGLILAWIDPDREPTKHSMIDFQQLKESFEKWGGAILFLMGPDVNDKTFSPASFPGLPQQTLFGLDDKKLLQDAENILKTKFSADYPVFLLIDSSGNIIDFSSGYKIGRGEQIVKMLKYLK
jgi:hypothetical protein